MDFTNSVRILSVFFIGFSSFVAQATPVDQSLPSWQTMLGQYGLPGMMLLWFMFRLEPRLRAIESAIYVSSKASLVLSMASPLMSPQGRSQAQAIVQEIDTAQQMSRGTPNP